MAGPKSFDVVTQSSCFSPRASNESPCTIEAGAHPASPSPDPDIPGTPLHPCP